MDAVTTSSVVDVIESGSARPPITTVAEVATVSVTGLALTVIVTSCAVLAAVPPPEPETAATTRTL